MDINLIPDPSSTDSEIISEDARKWAEDNHEFIQAYNLMIERDGLPLEEYRMF
jgi:antitoxin CcdA